MKLKLLTFHSVRGGVGRSRFAFEAAVNAANFFESAYLIEMGFEDTSIVDRLDVVAPRWSAGTKVTAAVFEDVAPVGFHAAGECRSLVNRRAACQKIGRDDEHFVPFLNDFFMHPTADWDAAHDVKLDAMLWRYNWGGTTPVHVLPASPLPRDISYMTPMLCDEWNSAFMEARLEVLLNLIVLKEFADDDGELIQNDKVVTVAIDCPRGMHGIARSVLSTGIRLSSTPKKQLAEDGYMPGSLEEMPIEWTGTLLYRDQGDKIGCERWMDVFKEDERTHVRLVGPTG